MMQFQKPQPIHPMQERMPMTPQQMDWRQEITVPQAQNGTHVITFNDPAALREKESVQQRTEQMEEIAALPQLDMKNHQSAEVIETPISLEEARLGSLKAMMSQNVGNYIVATFLVGTQNMVSWEGILYDVGNDYLTIYQESRDRYIVSDYYSLKFIEFYDTQRRAICNAVLQPGGMGQNGMN